MPKGGSSGAARELGQTADELSLAASVAAGPRRCGAPSPRTPGSAAQTIRPRDFQRARVYRWEAEHVFPLAADRLSLARVSCAGGACVSLARGPSAPDMDWAPPAVAMVAADGTPAAHVHDPAPAVGSDPGGCAARMRPRHGRRPVRAAVRSRLRCIAGTVYRTGPRLPTAHIGSGEGADCARNGPVREVA